MIPFLRHVLVVSAAASALQLAGCASTNTHDPRDPLESVNRATYAFNDTLDRAVLKPVAQGYNAIVPLPARNCVGNIFGNVSDAYTGVNNLLEGRFHDAGSDVCRVAVNTTVGVLGCFDVATGMGFQKHKKDFGITLGTWGVPPGPYLVIPFFGPSDARDAVGLVGDELADPLGYIYPVRPRNIILGVRIVDTRAQLLGASNLLQGAALDEYVFVRDGWYARRRSQVYNGNPPDDEDDNGDDNGDNGSTPAAPAAAPAAGAQPAAPAAGK